MVCSLLVQISRLIEVWREIEQSLQIYRDAVNQAKSAGDELASKWQGDAREAFVAEHEKAYEWHQSMIGIIVVIIASIKETVSRYQEADRAAKNAITGGGG